MWNCNIWQRRGFVSCIFMPLLFVKWWGGHFPLLLWYTPCQIVPPLGTTAAISWLDHTTGDGQTSNLSPLPMPEPQKVKPVAATKDVVGKRWQMLCGWEQHLLSLSLHGNEDSMTAFLHSLLSLLLRLYFFYILHLFLLLLCFPWKGPF